MPPAWPSHDAASFRNDPQVTDQTGKLQTDSNSLVHAFPLPTDIGFNPIIVLPPRPRFYALRRFANGGGPLLALLPPLHCCCCCCC